MTEIGRQALREVLQALVDAELLDEDDANDFDASPDGDDAAAALQTTIEAHYGM